jgi:hypothetical protein
LRLSSNGSRASRFRTIRGDGWLEAVNARSSGCAAQHCADLYGFVDLDSEGTGGGTCNLPTQLRVGLEPTVGAIRKDGVEGYKGPNPSSEWLIGP